jgi:long-chain fatty acid transport protein
MRQHLLQSSLFVSLLGGATLLVASSAQASNPLEYPDNGSASFSRGGAWLATANEPIAAHYNPAALATQGSGFSVEQNLNFAKVCYDRRGPGGAPEGPAGNDFAGRFGALAYLPACQERTGFPNAIPSISLAWRATKTLGFGFAVVPPATYGTADGAFPATSPGYNTLTGVHQQVPASYRFMQTEQLSTILYPTLSVGYELFKNFRVGAGFVSGIGVINTTAAGEATESIGQQYDTGVQDGLSTIKTRDLFVPGIVLSIHWSVTPMLDVSAWGRYMDSIRSTTGTLDLVANAYNSSPIGTSPSLSRTNPICTTAPASCDPNAIPYHYGNETFRKFVFPIPPEVRLGIRFHLPRSQATAHAGEATPVIGDQGVRRDPLHDDLFDVEVNGSYTFNASANTIEIRFADNGAGSGASQIPFPAGRVPPNSDRYNGYKDSFGLRVGGQLNVVQDKFAVRAGTWLETQSQEAEWLNIGVVGAMRGGYGGGIVFRQDFIDISIGYQRHWSQQLDNGGVGGLRGPITANSGQRDGHPEDALDDRFDNGKSAAQRTQYRTYHTVNDGRMSQSANVFTLGGTVRF